MLVETFLGDAPSRLETLRSAIAMGDARRAADTAHMLKGSCWALGAPRLAELCHELEMLARAGNLALSADLLARIEDEYGRVQAAFRTELGG